MRPSRTRTRGLVIGLVAVVLAAGRFRSLGHATSRRAVLRLDRSR